MRLVVLLTLLFFCQSINAQNQASMLSLYTHAADSKSLSEQFTKRAASESKAYQAVAMMISAKFGINPISKYRKFSQGRKSLEAAIKSEPNNLEYRYLRLAMQLNVPKILAYRDSIEEDTDMLKAALKSHKIQNPEHKQKLICFMKKYNLGET
ncbi:MAG: hypothetical protein LW817_00865 [Candidatus Caenarcaniphilales bacterium]|jgi:hypothetical protein|nr:hypothetical protein [Candidatus Caenarcaniphilales bacterium]